MSYASAFSFCAAFAVLMITLSDYSRLDPPLLGYYLALKISWIMINFGFGIYFYRHEVTDRSASMLILSLILFTLSMMWFLPLYEIAYFQGAIGTAFLRYKRPWIFPTTFFMGFLGVVATYKAQESLHWHLPPIKQSDWISTVFLFFVLAWCIQKFSIHAKLKERDRLLRFSIIGKETTRLIHDLKGVLSSPLLILESFKHKDLQPLSPEHQERQMALLIQDMDNVRETIKGIHRLVVHEDRFAQVDLSEVIQGSMKVLERRLASIEVKWPEGSFVRGKRDRLHSVFFNLFLNSLEAFERKGSCENKKIEIFWRKKTLVFQDNAGGLESDINKSMKGLGSGLGIELVQNDLSHMNARFKLTSTPPYTVAEISFGE